ncbi:MAG: hypothetical protein JRH16_20240 [Deltaproteobacteria bacterium]|nr:hypothetical protein [Deltaproteobacteria bacterium]MBW2362183.1 hypothetical protein [Deltaproteobacteria bacterium]
MRVTRRPILVFATTIALLLGWSAVRAGEREIAVLRTFDGHGQDRFTTLWVVDDASGFVWIRAHRPDRHWLSQLHEGPPVELRRGGRSRRYVARIFDDDRTRAYVAPWFRDKYGLADFWRDWSGGRDTVPVRLQVR